MHINRKSVCVVAGGDSEDVSKPGRRMAERFNSKSGLILKTKVIFLWCFSKLFGGGGGHSGVWYFAQRYPGSALKVSSFMHDSHASNDHKSQ